MKITEKPELRKPLKGPRTLHFLCDDGETYVLKELAAKCGLSEKCLLQRLLKKGWDHPNILAPSVPRGFSLDASPTKINRGTLEWRQISRRGPKLRIEDIPGPGILEQRYL